MLQALFNKLELDEKRELGALLIHRAVQRGAARPAVRRTTAPSSKSTDDTSRKGHSTTVVQGMEERYILNAGDGLRWLREGSVKRQVAATKCNDLEQQQPHRLHHYRLRQGHKHQVGERARTS